METIDEMYENMLKRCGVYCPTNDPQDSYQETNGNILECHSNDATGLRNDAMGEGIGFERIRRITGYLVGDVSHWNNGKLAELKDRTLHG